MGQQYKIEHMCGLLWLEALVHNLQVRNRDKRRQAACPLGAYDPVGVEETHPVKCPTRWNVIHAKREE